MKFDVLIIGGDSLIGSALFSYLSRTAKKVISTTRRKKISDQSRIYLDLKESPDRWVLPEKSDTAVICAGRTGVNACEKEPVKPSRVNVDATCTLAEHLIKKGTHVIFLSSNQVFDGSSLFPSPEDSISPITEYGKQKAETERRLLSRYPESVAVLRLTKVIGDKVPLFDQWIDTLKTGDKVSPFSDMYMAPIPLSSVVSAISLCLDRRLTGIHHFSANQDISYAEAAYEAAVIAGASAAQIQPASALNSGVVDVPFPLKTALDMNSLKLEFGIKSPEALWTIKQYFTNSITFL